ncbi:MAG: hypothetical protein JWR42_519 [Marmoricola sp.]|nr:hypothetical protein [Marmoricola sp.]
MGPGVAERPAGEARRTFGPVVLLGLATAGLAAVASSKPWIGGTSQAGTDATMSAVDTGTRYPLASALALVLLAAWGVLLVTRGRVRRAFAVLAALAAVGLVVAVVAGHAQLPDQARASTRAVLTGRSAGTGFTAWFWATAVAAVLAVVPAVLAVRLVGTWPEMGSRYDAPGARADREAREAPPAPETEQELWRALDAGHDPTDPAH